MSEAAATQPKLRMGGMALRNGLLVHGPTSWAVAVRGSDGELEVASGHKPSLTPARLGRVPFVRGPLRLAEGLAVLPIVRLRLRSVRLPYEDAKVIAAVIAAATAAAAARRLARGSARREALIAALGALPALVALRDRDLAAYHGAEHKAIGAYESDRDASEVPKEHPRCGSNLIGPLLALGLAGQLIVEHVVSEPDAITRTATSILATGAAVELFAFSERRPDGIVGRAVQGSGHAVQRRLSTREPSPEQLAVGEAAVAELLRIEALPADTTDDGIPAVAI